MSVMKIFKHLTRELTHWNIFMNYPIAHFHGVMMHSVILTMIVPMTVIMIAMIAEGEIRTRRRSRLVVSTHESHARGEVQEDDGSVHGGDDDEKEDYEYGEDELAPTDRQGHADV